MCSSFRPTRPHSRLVVIGIANTMDLPERMLPRIASRLGLQRIHFAPYTIDQLQAIIKSRLTGMNAFKVKAIELASRKAASCSGDVR
jgi:origin recognition complex subunit 1